MYVQAVCCCSLWLLFVLFFTVCYFLPESMSQDLLLAPSCDIPVVILCCQDFFMNQIAKEIKRKEGEKESSLDYNSCLYGVKGWCFSLIKTQPVITLCLLLCVHYIYFLPSLLLLFARWYFVFLSLFFFQLSLSSFRKINPHSLSGALFFSSFSSVWCSVRIQTYWACGFQWHISCVPRESGTRFGSLFDLLATCTHS